jgi:hypothetical protein
MYSWSHGATAVALSGFSNHVAALEPKAKAWLGGEATLSLCSNAATPSFNPLYRPKTSRSFATIALLPVTYWTRAALRVNSFIGNGGWAK